MSYYFDQYKYPYAGPESFADCGSRFVCGPTCCTVLPSAPAHGVGLYDRFAPAAPACGPALWPGAAPGCAYDARGSRGPAGWAEVGYIVSVRGKRHRAEERREHGNWHRKGRRSAAKNGKRPVSRSAPVASFIPRKDFAKYGANDDCGTESDFFRDQDDFYEDGALAVDCRARRYRLYARPAYGWCGSYDVHQWQYAVTEEGVPRCDAILIVLRDNPRVHGPRSLVWQELHTGDIVHVPGEPGPFRVHLYADDYFTH